MNETRRRPDTDPVALAPSVDRRWAEAFVVEQRLLGVPGGRIGDALVTVESHVRESGEDAQEAFGDPRDYARALTGAHEPPVLGPVTVVGLVLGLVGMLVVLLAFPFWLSGTAVAVSGGMLVVAGIVAGCMTLLLVAPTPTMRLVVERRWVALLLPFVLIGGMVGVLLVWPETLLELPAAPTAVVGLVLVAVSSVLSWLDYEDDRITAPGEQPGRSERARWGSALLTPALTLAMAGVMSLTHLLA